MAGGSRDHRSYSPADSDVEAPAAEPWKAGDDDDADTPKGSPITDSPSKRKQ